MGQIKLTVALVMIGLFTVAIIGFAMNFANDNSAPVSLEDDPELSSLYTKTGSNLSTFGEEAEDSYSSIVETTIEPESGVAQSTGPFVITPVNLIGIINNILRVGYIKIFGTGSGFSVFLTTFLGFLALIIGLYVYKTLRGQPD